ncbi:MAG: sulfotransferase family protein [Caulobacterales bacterium]
MTLKVIGAGFGRTGTLSLKNALEQLGVGPCYHMFEVPAKPERAAQWIAALDGAPDWESIFDGYTSTVDWPACHFWRELMDYYPEAKIILSVRDAAKWFASTQTTIFSPRLFSDGAFQPPPLFPEMVQRIVFGDVGGAPNDRDICVDAFNRHIETVKQTVPPERLLVYEASQGWAPLCALLGLPVPDAPYPSKNSNEQFASLKAAAN